MISVVVRAWTSVVRRGVVSRRGGLLGVGAGVLAIGVVIGALVWPRSSPAPTLALPLRHVAAVALPGQASRFDYADVDPAAHRLWIAHLGDSTVVEVDLVSRQVVRTIPDMANVTGVIVVPALHRVFASTPGTGQVVTLDEDSGAVLARAAAGSYPDGLAYASSTHQVWGSDESGDVETVLDARTGARLATVQLGGEAGNVRYDPVDDRVLVDVQSRDQVVVLDPRTRAITQRAHVAGCVHDHGLIIDARRAFVACDGNDMLVVLRLADLTPLSRLQVGHDPDVLALDPPHHVLYVAAESGVVTTIDTAPPAAQVTGRARVGDNAHVVAVDPSTGLAYFPLPIGAHGTPELRIMTPTG